MKRKRLVRGTGLLDNFIGNLRIRFVEKNIQDNLRTGKILDLGCGNYPKFLIETKFKEKFGIDKIDNPEILECISKQNITIINRNLEIDTCLPYESNSFDVITFLAVIEHFNCDTGLNILKEVFRVLKPGGMFIATTPNKWSHFILRILAFIGLASKIEIAEHKFLYNPEILQKQLTEAGFLSSNIKIKRFELGMNLCSVSKKQK